MPHVIVKLFPVRSEQQKTRLAEQITKVVMAEAVCDESAVSVSIIDIAPERWTPDVYTPDILGNPGALYKKPGYKPS